MMVTKKVILLCVFVLFFFVSCIPSTKQDELVHIVTSTAVLPASQVATATGTSSPILSPTAFPTLPTIPPEDAYALLLEMLNENATCELPCWLSITPGVSTHVDAYLKWAGFLTLLGTTKIEPRDFSYYFEYKENDQDFSIITRYYLQPTNDTIDSIYITTQTLRTTEDGIRDDVYDSIVYKKILNRYLLSSILTKYGQPDQILLSMDIGVAEATSPSYFSIWLFYPSRGAIINYEGEAIIENNIIKGCPSNTFVTLWLSAPGDNNLHPETLNQEIRSTSSQCYKSPEETIEMTSEEFYETFRNPTDKCIETPANLWSTPEP